MNLPFLFFPLGKVSHMIGFPGACSIRAELDSVSLPVQSTSYRNLLLQLHSHPNVKCITCCRNQIYQHMHPSGKSAHLYYLMLSIRWLTIKSSRYDTYEIFSRLLDQIIENPVYCSLLRQERLKSDDQLGNNGCFSPIVYQQVTWQDCLPHF